MNLRGRTVTPVRQPPLQCVLSCSTLQWRGLKSKVRGNPASSITCAEGKGIPVFRIPTAKGDVAESVGTGTARGCSQDGSHRVSWHPGVWVVTYRARGGAPCIGKCPYVFRSVVASRQFEQNCWKGAARPQSRNPLRFCRGGGGPWPGHPANEFSTVA